MPSLFPDLFVFREFAPLILRLVLGAVLILHAKPKFLARPIDFWILAPGILEGVAGVLLLAGFLTQAAVLFAVLDRLAALFKTKFRGELNWVLVALALSLSVLGPGKFSLDLPF